MKKERRLNPNAHLPPTQTGAPLWPQANPKAFLFHSVDALPLGVFRFLFGLLLCVEFFVLSPETFPADYVKPSFHFTYPIFDALGLRALPEPYLWAIFRAVQVSSVAIALGLLTRLSLVVFTAGFGYFFLQESTVYTNHYYLIFLLGPLLAIGHSGSIFSIDSLLRKAGRREQVGYWEIYLLRFQICIVFFYGAAAKMNADWLVYGAPLYLNFIKNFTLLGHPLQEHWIALALSWGGMLTDLALAILLATGRWRKLTFVWLCLFNGLNVVFFGVGIKTFPYMMIASFVLFLPEGAVRTFLARFGSFFRAGQKPTHRASASPWVLGLVIGYTLFQLLFPLRHWLYKRNVHWTHEGIAFSWHMMADRHDTNGQITVEDPRTGDVYLHSAQTILSRKQLVMVNNPYTLLQYVRYLKEYLPAHSGVKDPIVRAEIEVSVNGRPFQPMYDKTADLTKVSYSPFQDLPWIYPFASANRSP